MILAPNHRQLLNGNRLLVIAVILLLIEACSPKVTKPVVVETAKPVSVPTVVKVTKPKTEPQSKTYVTLSLLLPFKLDNYALKTVTSEQLAKADLPLDFYQGVLMGIDSGNKNSQNIKLNVFDTQEDEDRLTVLSKKAELKESQLIIGPIFPNEIKNMSTFSIAQNIPMVSPLAASSPTDFSCPTLISVTPDLVQHAVSIADYIGANYKPSETIVVLINSKTSSEEAFASPLKQRLIEKFSSFPVQEFSSVNVYETKIVKNKKYLLIFCSDNNKVVSSGLSKLYRLKTSPRTAYPIRLFGHPNWQKQHYNVEQLMALQTVISTSYFVDYKKPELVDFVKNYRSQFKIEPGEYAIKGFDVGFYFANLLVKHGKRYMDWITKEKYKGLHNTLDFVFDTKFGYQNKHLQLLTYKNHRLVQLTD